MSESSQNIRAKVLEKISGAAPGAGASKGNVTVNAHTILKNLDSQFVTGYIQRLEAGTQYLQGYLDELAALDKRMEKLSVSVRAALGGRAIDKKRAAIKSTLRKLRAHQSRSVDRLLPG